MCLGSKLETGRRECGSVKGEWVIRKAVRDFFSAAVFMNFSGDKNNRETVKKKKAKTRKIVERKWLKRGQRCFWRV